MKNVRERLKHPLDVETIGLGTIRYLTGNSFTCPIRMDSIVFVWGSKSMRKYYDDIMLVRQG